MEKKYIYLDKNKAIQGIAEVIRTSNTKIENYNYYFERNAIEYYSNDIPGWIAYDIDTDTIREATIQELFDRGKYIPKDNQYVKDGIIKDIPLMPNEFIKGEFNIETETWIETSTLEDKINKCEYMILEKTKELKLYQDAGFEGSFKVEELKNKIEKLKNNLLNLHCL